MRRNRAMANKVPGNRSKNRMMARGYVNDERDEREANPRLTLPSSFSFLLRSQTADSHLNKTGVRKQGYKETETRRVGANSSD